MILVDTSVWVNHLRVNDELLMMLISRNEVLMHPFVIGELAMGNMRQRDVVIKEVHRLPSISIATNREVMFLVDQYRLFGTGIGYIDAHLLAAARLTGNVALWTHDRRLHGVAHQLNLAAYLTH